METTLVQALAAVAFLGLLCLATRVRKTHQRALLVSLAILSGVLMVFLGRYHIKNAFHTFPTAEEAAKYANQGEVLALKQGNHSSLALYAVDDTDVQLELFPKVSDGYKLGRASLNNAIATAQHGTCVGKILYCQGDYYAFVIGATSTEDTVILDPCNSDFTTIVKRPSSLQEYIDTNTFSVVSVAMIQSYDENYSITVRQSGAPAETLFLGDEKTEG